MNSGAGPTTFADSSDMMDRGYDQFSVPQMKTLLDQNSASGI